MFVSNSMASFIQQLFGTLWISLSILLVMNTSLTISRAYRRDNSYQKNSLSLIREAFNWFTFCCFATKNRCLSNVISWFSTNDWSIESQNSIVEQLSIGLAENFWWILVALQKSKTLEMTKTNFERINSAKFRLALCLCFLDFVCSRNLSTCQSWDSN